MGLGDEPVKDLMWTGWILRIMSPDKLHLLNIWRYIPSLMIKERLRFAFGGESCNRCLLLLFNLFLGRPFLFLLWCTESLIEIGELFLNKVTRVKCLDCIGVELLYGVGEGIVIFYHYYTAQTHLLLRVCCVFLRALATEWWKVLFFWFECCLWSRDKMLLSWRLLVMCHFWTLCLMMLNEFARFLVG
jgi:hypothetical protein